MKKDNDPNNKILLLVRHGKSSWKDTGISDQDRPLSKKGMKDATKMGKIIKALSLIPDIIISSSAKRATDTATYISEFCGYNKQIEIDPSLYLSDSRSYINTISTISNSHNRVLIVGHNPTLEELVEVLTKRIEKIPTCALVHININIPEWQLIANIGKYDAIIVNIWKPKKIKL